MSQKGFCRFLLTYDNPNPIPNPNTEKQNFFLKKARALASVSQIN